MSSPAAVHAPAHTHAHARVPLRWLFFALLVLTAAEVVLYEIWSYTANHFAQPFVPKYVIVLLILIFTLPKAAIVMVYFMHLKFERQLIVSLAVLPFGFAFLAVVVTLSDTLTLKPDADNRVLIAPAHAPLTDDGNAVEHSHEPDPGHPAPY
jgi:cytochrome c oxidase subunit IV